MNFKLFVESSSHSNLVMSVNIYYFLTDVLTHFVELEFDKILTTYKIDDGESKNSIKKYVLIGYCYTKGTK